MITEKEKIKLREKIIKNDLENVFSFLVNSSNGTKYFNGVILMVNRYKRLKSDKALGTIGSDEFNIESNKILSSVLLSIENPDNFILKINDKAYLKIKNEIFQHIRDLTKFGFYYLGFSTILFAKEESLIQYNNLISPSMLFVNIVVVIFIISYFIHLIMRLKK